MSQTGTTAAAADMKELTTIVAELKLTNMKARDLRTRKKELESRILTYLDETDAPGLRYKELVVLRSDSTTHARKNKKDKEESIVKVLEDMGIDDPKKAYEQITQAMIGEAKQVTKLRVKQTIPELL